jgi:hypothetical protein
MEHQWRQSTRVSPSARCVGATIHEQALSSEVCDWAGGVGVVAARQRTSSLQPGRRLGDGQAALRHCVSLEAEGEKLHARELPGHHLATSFPAGG